ncbi:MAG: ATP-binding cassette domain-containing protein, partial [Janthinobacterium lividum]
AIGVGGDLSDPDSGVVAAAGRFTALVCDPPEDAADLARRLTRFDDDTRATFGGVALREMAVARVRERVVLAEDDAQLFSGTLREQVDPEHRRCDADVLAAMAVSDAVEILEQVDGGLDATVTERGRSLSGGQRQRLALARVLLRAPEALVLVDPTSAVDAHTEARIAGRLRSARAGVTTLVATASPLVLPQVDDVCWVRGGRLAASGSHADLLARNEEYRRFVTRDVPEDAPTQLPGRIREELS